MAKKRRPNILMAPVCAIVMIAVLAACAFPFLNLREGSLLYAVLNPLHSFLDDYANVFAGGNLRTYGLIPVAILSVVDFVLAMLGSGLISFLLRCVAFYSLYLLGTVVQHKAEVFRILSSLPSFYPLIAIAAFLASVVLLLLIRKIKRGGSPKKAKAPETGSEIPAELPLQEDPGSKDNPEPVAEAQKPVEPRPFSLSFREEEIPQVKREPEAKYEHDQTTYRKAIDSLVDVKTPEYQTFPNYSLTASVSSIDRGNYNVAELEAKIRAEEQRKIQEELERKRQEEERKKKEAEEQERIRREAEANRKRIENLFKPRNLMKKLNEDVEVEKSFPSYAKNAPSMDFSAAESRPEEPKAEPAAGTSPSYSPRPAMQFGVSSERSDIPVSQQIPPSQMSNPYAYESAPAPAVEEEEPQEQPTSVFRQASEQAEQDAQLVFRKRQAELERKHLEEMQELERKRQEAEEAARKAEELLQQTKAEMQRQADLAKAEADRRAAEEKAAAEAARKAAEEEEEEGISDADMAANDAKEKAKGPDVDYVSGVAGLKSSIGGNSYLLDKQKFKYEFPPENILKHYEVSAKVYEDPENDPDGQTIVETFRQFRIETSLVHIQHGPTFTLYELTLAKGIKVTSVLAYSENIAMELSVEDVRILAPIPGKALIGVEVPNKKRDIIGFDVMMPALKAKFYKIPMVLGKTITGDSVVIDVAKTPHLLVAGTTGSGKSVAINGLICSVLYTKTPKEVRMIMVDPKMVELSLYNGIPHLLTPVITDAKKALKAMNFVVEEMERRMTLFSSIGAKKIEEYNQKIDEKKLARVKLPYIMVIIDEFADLMLAVGKELETSIKRITAVARFCGIHLILATQRPSADVITGVIKSNIPTQIAFAVSNSTNSRIIIDQVGAEKLLGRGDMLYNNPESRQPSRIQGAFIDSEIEQIVSFVKTQGEPDYIDESYFEDTDDDEEEAEEASDSGAEDLFSKAWKIVTDRGEASASYLQRKLGIGYNRAANLIEQMEDAGYVGPARGSKPREILKMYGSD